MTALVCAIPGLTYWLVGPLKQAGDERHLDHMWRTPIPESTTTVVGVGSVLVVGAVVVFMLTARRAPLNSSLRYVIALTSAAGALLASGYRVTTAGGSGANIGGGLVVMLVGPFCAFLIVTAAVVAFKARPRPGV